MFTINDVLEAADLDHLTIADALATAYALAVAAGTL